MASNPPGFLIIHVNRSALLGEAIESVLAQTYAEFELVIADDGSTDDTESRIADCQDPRVRYIRLGHTGSQSVARWSD